MSYAAKVLGNTVRRLILVQVGLAAVAALIYGLLTGAFGAASALYGGATAVAGTTISAWRLLRATRAAGQDVRRGMMELYLGAGLRFGLTLVLFIVGMGLLRLDPLAIIIGFALAQLGYLFNRVDTDLRH